MGGGVPGQAFKSLRDVEGAADQRVGIARRLQPRLVVDRALERNRIEHVLRHQLAQAVDLPVRHLQHAADIAQHAARLQRAEGDDLCHLLAAVLFLYVADDLVAPLLTEVDVEIRHGNALRIEKALKQEFEADRVEIGNGQRIGDQRAGARAASGPDRNAFGFRPLDEIGNDQKIAGVFHAGDDSELVVETGIIFLDGVAVGRTVLGEPRGKPVLGGATKLVGLLHFVGVVAAERRRKPRQDWRLHARPEGTALGNLDGGRKRLGQVGEQSRHLGPALEAMLRRQLAALAIGDQLAVGDAQQRIVCFVILGCGEVGLIGRDQRNAARVGEFDQNRLHRAFARHAVTLHLEIKAIAEQMLQHLAARLHQRVLSGGNRRIERAARPAGERDQSVRRARQPGGPDVRALVRLGVKIGSRAQPHQAAVALLARRQQHDTGEVLGGRPARPTLAALVAEVDRERTADDRLNAGARHFF